MVERNKVTPWDDNHEVFLSLLNMASYHVRCQEAFGDGESHKTKFPATKEGIRERRTQLLTSR